MDISFKIAKNVKDKSVNKFTSFKLIAYNDKMSTNHVSKSTMLMFKSLIEYLIFQYESNERRKKTGN